MNTRIRVQGFATDRVLSGFLSLGHMLLWAHAENGLGRDLMRLVQFLTTQQVLAVSQRWMIDLDMVA
jgi:hypothetical protein